MNSYASATDALLIAEGIETEEEFRTLSEIGVPLLQGFLLARPAEPWPQPAAERLAAPRRLTALPGHPTRNLSVERA